MANFVINLGAYGIFGIVGQDASATQRALSALTATIDNYTDAYVANIPGGSPAGSGALAVVSRGNAPGSTITVNISLVGKDMSGNTLPTVILSVDIVEPTPPPLATQVVVVLSLIHI